VASDKKFIGQQIREASLNINEYEEMIAINIAIIMKLRERGLIKEDDPEYLEILKIHKENQEGYKNFLLNRLPGYLGYGRNKKLEEEFISWITKYKSHVRAEDKILKRYIDTKITDMDKNKLSGAGEIKDKRFWRFLDNFRKKETPFDSFRRENED